MAFTCTKRYCRVRKEVESEREKSRLNFSLTHSLHETKDRIILLAIDLMVKIAFLISLPFPLPLPLNSTKLNSNWNGIIEKEKETAKKIYTSFSLSITLSIYQSDQKRNEMRGKKTKRNERNWRIFVLID
jgi:hypothetical protein